MIPDRNAFENETALMLDVLIAAAGVRDEDQWFIEHATVRILYMYENNPYWRKWLSSRVRRIDARDQCKVWIRHWYDAYNRNRGEFMAKCPHGIFLK